MRFRRHSNLVVASSLLVLALVCTACGEANIAGPTEPAHAASRAASGELEIVIQISPATLILDSPGTWVTVHAEIAYSDVDHATLTMNGVELVYSKSDNRGELVVKFAREDVQDIVSPPEALLTLTGFTIDGTPFVGSQIVPVQ